MDVGAAADGLLGSIEFSTGSACTFDITVPLLTTFVGIMAGIEGAKPPTTGSPLVGNRFVRTPIDGI